MWRWARRQMGIEKQGKEKEVYLDTKKGNGKEKEKIKDKEKEHGNGRKVGNAEIEASEADFDPHAQMRAMCGPATEILPFLLLGSTYNASSKEVDDAKVTHVLNVAEEADPTELDDHIRFLKLAIADMSPTPQEGEPGKCLVHCMRGRSRSAAVVIAYLMKRNGMDLRTAYLHVRERRQIIGPHYYLKGQLLVYEKILRGENSLTIEEWQHLQNITRSAHHKMAY